jgi:hypothetical protein
MDILNGQWDRFDYYVKRVRSLSVTGQSGNRFFDSGCYERLVSHRGVPILPNLIRLTWLRPSNAKQCPYFMHPGVVEFKVRVPFEESTPSMSVFFQTIAEQMPLMTRLDVDEWEVPYKGISGELAKVIPKLKELRTFKAAGHLDRQVFEQLALLPHLHHLESIYGVPEMDETEIPSDLPGDAFGQLNQLTLTICLPALGDVLKGNTIFGGLETLVVQRPVMEETTPEEVWSFFGRLASACATICNVSVDLQLFVVPMRMVSENDQIGLAHIAPLFGARRIVRFRLMHTYPLLLANEDLAAFGDAWRGLEDLELNHEPCVLEQPTLTWPALHIIEAVGN